MFISVPKSSSRARRALSSAEITTTGQLQIAKPAKGMPQNPSLCASAPWREKSSFPAYFYIPPIFLPAFFCLLPFRADRRQAAEIRLAVEDELSGSLGPSNRPGQSVGPPAGFGMAGHFQIQIDGPIDLTAFRRAPAEIRPG